MKNTKILLKISTRLNVRKVKERSVFRFKKKIRFLKANFQGKGKNVIKIFKLEDHIKKIKYTY